MVKNVIFLLKRILKDRKKENNFKKKKTECSHVCYWPGIQSKVESGFLLWLVISWQNIL